MSTKQYFKSLVSSFYRIDHDEIQKVINTLREAKERNAQVFTFGNGGSAATAIHFANDLVKMCGIKAQAMTNVSILTAFANDIHYRQSFAFPLRTLMNEGDIAIGISCSGKSENVLNALIYAKEHGVTISLTGDRRAEIMDYSDICIHAPHKDIKVQEDIHLMICHAIAGELSNGR